VEATGPKQPDGRTFSVKTVRMNPADPGAGTASQSNSLVNDSIFELIKIFSIF